MEKIRLFSTVPVIILSGRSEEVDQLRGLEIGADDYIVKPINERELLARVAAAKRSVALKRNLSDARYRADESLAKLHEAQAKLIEEKKTPSH